MWPKLYVDRAFYSLFAPCSKEDLPSTEVTGDTEKPSFKEPTRMCMELYIESSPLCCEWLPYSKPVALSTQSLLGA